MRQKILRLRKGITGTAHRPVLLTFQLTVDCRTHNELVYSLRAALQAFRASKAVKAIHLLTSDLPAVNDTNERDGLVPTWLDPITSTSPTSDYPPVHVSFPWNVWQSSSFSNLTAARIWRETSLPTFNSMAVESQLPNLPNLSDVWMCA